MIKSIKRNFLLGLIIVLPFLSCKKDKLEGKYSILTGEWEWVRSTGGESGNLLNTPASEGYSRTIKFMEKGKYKVYKNGSKEEDGRIIIHDPSTFSTSAEFEIELKPKTKVFGVNRLSVYTNMDTLSLRGNCNDCLTDVFVKK